MDHLTEDEVIEALAALAHEQWSGWMRYLFGKCEPISGYGTGVAIPPASVDRWCRQAATPYADLPEEEKESDRVEARKVVKLLAELGPLRHYFPCNHREKGA